MRLVLALALHFAALPAWAETATVAVATNFLNVAQALGAAYATVSGQEIVLVGGATGKLAAQISNGAPFDLFLSADAAAPERLIAAGLAEAESRVTYATGDLVLWAPDTNLPAEPAAILAAARHVAIANPDLAPYGLAAAQAIDALGLAPLVAGKLVQGENIGQTFALVHTGAADAGFVAASATHPVAPAGTLWPVPDTLHDPIRQDAVLLAHGADNAAATGFLEYLASAEAKAVITAAGYGVLP
ncbi:molybdate ABC transporter substrate-binding protein [Albidovulum sediminicola]|uniref:Molybdate ABC transporter substrate-binding protein n=1 Tax=Albidovulum sediminicola TaxID=2984331 RepID=A0ABT2Z1E4_9RHOB|nr:molybdate ABC transporter substrate-binding protein [Defluviimonas sp. WL0075]MCV2864905.1 molybdate ABC transporter substrate-binding protein [Defluviimonas sp. WL0075]